MAHAWTLPRLGALVHQLQVYTCSLLEASGSGIVHVLALKLGNKTLIKLGSSQWPDCVCSQGRVQAYGDSLPEGTRLAAVHCDSQSASSLSLGKRGPPALHPAGL